MEINWDMVSCLREWPRGLVKTRPVAHDFAIGFVAKSKRQFYTLCWVTGIRSSRVFIKKFRAYIIRKTDSKSASRWVLQELIDRRRLGHRCSQLFHWLRRIQIKMNSIHKPVSWLSGIHQHFRFVLKTTSHARIDQGPRKTSDIARGSQPQTR